MLRFWHHFGILGINARNLLYLKPFNTRERIAFADDKMRTKKYLSVRGVKTARMLGKISSEKDIMKFPWETLPNDFVLKPNSGYGGEGIWVIKNRENDGWLNTNGEFISQTYMEDHMNDILDGRYSITGDPDQVFFEQRLVCHPDMGILGKFGLPDIRIIVFNLVPVMAMVRVPTKESKGKANLHMGGMGLGIDLAKGETTHINHHNRVIQTHPDFQPLKGVKIPFWDDILLLATKIQQKVTLGYLAVDIVIDEHMGPTLLEINARAGLGVQIANLAPLRDRLDRVAGIAVKAPEKGVRIAQDLFGNKMERRIQQLSGKKVIGMEEELVINLKHGTKTIMARMNPTMKNNYLNTMLFKKIAGEGKKKTTLNYTLKGERGKAVFSPLDMHSKTMEAILGKTVLANFFLDVGRGNKAEISKITDTVSQATFFQPWHVIDNKLAEIDRKLNLVAHLRPLNLEAAREAFFSSEIYEPKFTYLPAPSDLLDIRSALQLISIDSRVPIGKLLEEKRQELLLKAQLMDVIGDDQHFPALAQALMGPIPESICEEASRDLLTLKQAKIKKRAISSFEAVQIFQAHLLKKGLWLWKVKEKKGMVSRCSIGKNNTLLIKAEERFNQDDIKKLIAHEIETHIYCAENGKLQPYQIFRRGTAHYLKTQEGLAIQNQLHVDRHGLRMALFGFHAVKLSTTMGFREVFQNLKKMLSSEEAFSFAVKAKRGLSNTANAGAFLKNALYYWGYKEVREYLKKGGSWKDLFLGKFSLHQLSIIKQIEGLKEARYVPEEK